MASQPLRRTTVERTLSDRPKPVIERALERRDAKKAPQVDLWSLTPAERVAAFWDSRLTFGQCLEWSRRAPHEVPKASDGEFLYIACRTPEWLGE